MKKIWLKLGLILGAVVAAVVLYRKFVEHENQAHDSVMKNLPKQIGIATEEYKKKMNAELAKIRSDSKAEIIAKFSKAFGG